MDSIITKDMEHCFICKTTRNLEIHHCIHGQGNRAKSEEYGLKVPLCIYCHKTIHVDRKADLKLIQMAQRVFEETHNREQTIEKFGRSYL